MTIALLPGYVELRDRGIIKKKVRVKDQSFQEVLEEINSYFMIRGKRLPPGVLKDTLIRIGVPEARRILSSTPIEKEPEPVTEEIVKPEIETSGEPAPPTMVEEITAKAKTESKEAEIKFEPASEKPKSAEHKVGKVTLEEKDFADIEEALSLVESLSDTFMAPKSNEEITEAAPIQTTKISIRLDGSDEIVASNKSTATDPRQSQMIDKVDAEEIEDAEQAAEIPQLDEHVQPEELVTSDEEESAIDEIPVEKDDEPVTIEAFDTTISTEKVDIPKSKHVVNPMIDAKIVILGEAGVGKASLMEKAGLRKLNEIDPEKSDKEYISAGVMKVPSHRVSVKVWSFDAAVKSRIPRNKFYESADVAIIVYSISDRWSFESVDFWLKEIISSLDDLPPIVLVGNKKDIRDSKHTDPLEPPVTGDEGLHRAEQIAESLGVEKKLHPVAFIEASCLTSEGVESVFNTAAELYVNTL